MYIEVLNKRQNDFCKIIFDVLENLHEDTVIELKKIFEKNYIEKTYEAIKDYEIHVIKLNNDMPVGLFGVIPFQFKTAGIFLLTTKNLAYGNKIKFLREAKKIVKKWEVQYELLMDSCYKKNEKIKKWLLLLGFVPSKYEDENFQIYYKGNIELYEGL